MTDRLATNDVLIPNFDDNALVELSQFLDWDVHDLELPVRVFTPIDTDAGLPKFFPNLNCHEGVHFMKDSRSSVVREVRRLNVKLDVSLGWNHKITCYAPYRRLDNDLWCLLEKPWISSKYPQN